MDFLWTLILCLASVSAANKVNIERSKAKIVQPVEVAQLNLDKVSPPSKAIDTVDLTGLPDNAEWQKVKSFPQHKRRYHTRLHDLRLDKIVAKLSEGGVMKHRGLTLIGHKACCEAVAASYDRLAANSLSAPYLSRSKARTIMCVGLSDCLGASFSTNSGHSGLIAVDPCRSSKEVDKTLFHELLHGCEMDHDQIEPLEERLQT